MEYPNDHRTPPSPWITHAEMAPVHQKIGSLEKGQEHILNTYSHLRGEMLTHFEHLEKLLKERVRPEPPRADFTQRELILLGVALVVGGAVLGAMFGVDSIIGG